jgi:hypothetical protein
MTSNNFVKIHWSHYISYALKISSDNRVLDYFFASQMSHCYYLYIIESRLATSTRRKLDYLFCCVVLRGYIHILYE